MLVRMKLTTTVIPIINTSVIDILMEPTASIAGILLFFHCFQYSWEKRNVKYGISIGLDHVSDLTMSFLNSGILWPGHSDQS